MYRTIFALLLFLVACGEVKSGTNPPGDNPSTGSFPAELSGVWQDTRSSSGEFTNVYTGITFTMTQGYSAQFKVKPNGEFYFAHYSQGVSSTCPLVSFFDQMVGLAEWSGDRLTLRPRERRLDVQNCANSGSLSLALDAVTFEASLTDYPTFIDTSLQMELSGGPYPLKFKLLNRTPPKDPTQPLQPEGFQLGSDTPYQEILGRWGRREVDFYDPQTGAYQFPQKFGDHQFIRFLPEGYEMGFGFNGGNQAGACKRNLIYFERGKALFAITSWRSADTAQGDLRLEPTEARLITRVRECDSDNEVKEYTLKPLTSYHRWSYTDPSAGEDFMMGCHYPGHAWSFAVCYSTSYGTSPWINFERRQ